MADSAGVYRGVSRDGGTAQVGNQGGVDCHHCHSNYQVSRRSLYVIFTWENNHIKNLLSKQFECK